MDNASNGLEARLKQSLSSVDRVLTRIDKLLKSPANVDTVLLTATYSLHLLHSIFERLSDVKTSSIVTIGSSPSAKPKILVAVPSTRWTLIRLQKSITALCSTIDDYRIFRRLWNLFSIWSWASTTLRMPHSDAFLRAVGIVQIFTNVVFQTLENAAYLASKGVLNPDKRRFAKWYTWSSRFWAVHILLEFARLGRIRQLKSREQKMAEFSETPSDKEQAKADEVDDAKWNRDFYANAAWMPVALHFGAEQGLLAEGPLAAFGLIPGISGLREAWKTTRS